MAQKKDKRRANLRDVARTAGVSVATVSRVLNTPDVVRAGTRNRVEAVISELGFHPSAAARAINSGRTKIIGALIPSIDNDIFAQTIDSIEQKLEDLGFSLVVATTGGEPQRELARARELLNIGIEGLFLSGVSHSDDLLALLAHTRVPAIATSYFDPDFVFPTIGYDNCDAAEKALDHLVKLGHRNIAIVHGPTEDNDRTRDRLRGATVERNGVIRTCFQADMDASGGASAVTRIMSEAPNADAVLCLSDVQALGALFQLQRLRISVPGQISVMGLHDLPSASITYPTLSTIHLPARSMGEQAAAALAKWIEDDVRPASICLATTLIERESTGQRTIHPSKD